jgi:hypothetical protein
MDPRQWSEWCRRQDVFFSSDSAASIADKNSSINQANKFLGKPIVDTTNHRLMIARGSNSTDPWDVVDGSASVTPA